MAADVLGFIRDLGLGQASLIGHSMYGSVLQALAETADRIHVQGCKDSYDAGT